MRVFEHQEIKIGNTDADLPLDIWDYVVDINTKMIDEGTIKRPFYKISGLGVIKFSSYAGILLLGGNSIEILPKIFRKNEVSEEHYKSAFLSFLKMMSYILGYEEKDLGDSLRIIESEKANILEVLILLFTAQLKRALRIGPFQNYESVVIENEYLAGKVLIERQLMHPGQVKLIQETFLYAPNTELMRYMKSSTLLFLKLTQNRSTKQELDKILRYMDEVEIFPLQLLKSKHISISRLADHFKGPYFQTRLILDGLSFLSDDRSNQRSISFLFDMNKKFEEFLAEFIERNARKLFPNYIQCKVNKQYSEKWLFHGRPSRKLKPDLLLELKNQNSTKVIIIDAKYKVLDHVNFEQEEIPDVVISDLYQMYAYSTKHNAIDTVIVYPSNISKCRYQNEFLPGRHFMVWSIDVNLNETNWEDVLIRDFKTELINKLHLWG